MYVVTYKYEVQCFDCHSEGNIMCMQTFRIILYWTLNYYPFASFDHALENQHHFFLTPPGYDGQYFVQIILLFLLVV